MSPFHYLRPRSIEQARAWLLEHPDARLLAGGQSLLAAMKLGLNAPSHLIDLQGIPGLNDISLAGNELWIGAMATHACVAASPQVRAFAPMLAQLAGGIADAQVRQVGTLGGALANNDPAACWPAGVLALGATLVSTAGAVKADDFFQGLYGTALARGDVLLGVRFARPVAAHYLKQEQPASRFALVGVAVSRFATPGTSAGHTVRVAITGLGHGVQRWPAAERALAGQWAPVALNDVFWPEAAAQGDVQASAEYRAHLAGVLCRRAVAVMTGLPAQAAPAAMPVVAPVCAPARTAAALQAAPADTAPPATFAGAHALALPLAQVWQGLLDPAVLQACLPGCEALQQTAPHHYTASVKVGLGPVSARFQASVSLNELAPPDAAGQAGCLLLFAGQAAGLGGGEGQAQVRLRADGNGTHLTWQAQARVNGKLAQFGNRLVQASARHLSDEFFVRFAARLGGAGADLTPLRRGALARARAAWLRGWRRLFGVRSSR